MKFENFATARSNHLNSSRSQSHLQSQHNRNSLHEETSLPLTNANLRRQRHSGGIGIGSGSGNGVGVGGGLFGCGFSDKDSLCSANSIRGKRIRSRNIPMKSSKSVMKKSKVMDYTNYAYNEAVGRLKLMLADSYSAPTKSSFGGSGLGGAYLRNYSEDSADNFSDNLSVIERPVYSDISKYLSPSQRSRFGASARSRKPFSGFSSSKENLALPAQYHISTPTGAAATVPSFDYLVTPKPQLASDSVQAPAEIFNFIEKQEDYIEQLEKESKYCRNELTNLLGKVKDVINENEHLTETARSELATLGGVDKSKLQLSPSSDDSEATVYTTIKAPCTPRSKDIVKSPRYANAPSIVYEARISELEAELMQANIDLKRLRTENEELKRKLSLADPVTVLTGSQPNNQLVSVVNCDIHRKQIENLQLEKTTLEETVRHLQKSLDEAKSQQYNVSSKRYMNDLIQMERSQAELEVKHLRDELDRQHERVRELQHEMARRIAEERANAERRYNSQVDQLGGDLSNQWEQVAKLQLDLERQKRYETDLKRDLANRNAQIEELKMELRSNRSTFLADMAQTSAEKQSLEQEITALRLQLDRAAREAKTDASRYAAELNSLRQRMDRGDADLLHSKREVLRLNDEIANLEKELAYGEMKNEIRPTKKDLDKRISELQEQHGETVNELEAMIQSQKQLMDRLTTECKVLTNKLEDTTLKHNQDKQRLRETNTQLLERLKQIWVSYKDLSASKRDSQKRRHSLSSLGSGESTTDSGREEHFSACAPSLVKPLSTTSRPCLMQPTPQPQLSAVHRPQQLPSKITANHSAPVTTTTHNPLKPQVQVKCSEPHQILQQQQHRPLMTHQNTNQALSIPVETTNQTTPPNMDSVTMMTKILKTTSVQAKNNNCNNQQITPQAVNRLSLPTKWEKIQLSNQYQRHRSTPAWVAVTTPVTDSLQMPQLPTTMLPTTPAMKDTIPHSMTQLVPTTQAPTTSHSTMPVNTMQREHMPLVEDSPTMPVMVITQQANMTRMHINSTSRQLSPPQQHQRHQQHSQQPHQHQRSTSSRPRQQLRRHPQIQTSPQSQQVAQQQKAEHNRARAQELWGQQVLLEPESPRSPLKSNRSLDVLDPLVDPLDLELSISSPSLLRSSSSDGSVRIEMTEMADVEFDSISDMSISPAPTAICRLPNVRNCKNKTDRTTSTRSSNTL